MIVYLRSEDPARNRHRHYLGTLQRDLWGDLVVVKRWGRIGATGWQGEQTVAVNGEAEGAKVVRETLKRRRGRGYDVVGEEMGQVGSRRGVMYDHFGESRS